MKLVKVMPTFWNVIFVQTKKSEKENFINSFLYKLMQLD